MVIFFVFVALRGHSAVNFTLPLVMNVSLFFFVFYLMIRAAGVAVSHIVFLQVNQGLPVASQNLVTIRMKPDENGRFGFNVKVRQILSA